MSPPELIIDRPHLVSGLRRILYGTMTLAFWYVWLYLWLPVATFVAWAFGAFLGYRQIIELKDYIGIIETLLVYALVVVILGGTLLAWAMYNLVRFRGKERRGPLPDVPLQDYALHLGVVQDELSAWRRAKGIHVHHDRNGHIEKVDVLPASVQSGESRRGPPAWPVDDSR